MKGNIDLDGLTKRTRRLEFEDGLIDFQNALVFLVLGLLASVFMSEAGITMYMRGMLFNSEVTTIALVALIPMVILITFGVRRLITSYRRNVLWRAIGEIEPLRWQVDTRYNVLAALAWLAVVIVGWVFASGSGGIFDNGIRIFIGASGIATGLIYYLVGRSLQVVRYRWVGACGALLSAALIPLPLDASTDWLLFGIVWSVTLSISGAFGLRGMLRRIEKGAQ